MLTGSLVAIATPMRKGGALDLPALGKLIDFHVANGTAGIVIVGTTGESPTVDFDEHCLLIKTAVEQARGRIPVIAGTGRQLDRRGDRAHRLREGGRRAQLPVGRPVLQQADAGRPVPAFPRDRRNGRPAAHPVQRAGPDGRRSRQRHRAAPRAGSGHRRHQGRDGGPGARQRAHPGAALRRPAATSRSTAATTSPRCR